ncbi:MAG: type II toxin-antitoxin system HigB family toxin [Bacteroides sp.]|nr:type II toxin-antitoxin system HigB family toxin [Bacteroides sp.]
MILSNKELLNEFIQKNSRAVKPMNKWIDEIIKASWQSHIDLKNIFPSADYVGNGRYVFNISGNNYRIIAIVLFVGGIMELRFVGTHADYSKIKNCAEI